MGSATLRKTSVRAGGLGATLAIVATVGIGGASAASAAPSSPCESGNHNACENTTVLQGHYGSALACDNQGRYYMSQEYEEAGVTYGTYAWTCDSRGGQWSLTLHQYAYR